MTFHTRSWKENDLKEIENLLGSSPVIAVVDLHRFPAALFAGLRKKLSRKAKFKVSKTKVIKKAFENAGEKKALNDFVGKSCGLIFTDMNPFELFSYLKKNKGSVAAKEGQLAEQDIVIPARDTGLPPGPALSDLKAAGLDVRIQGQTIVITKDKVVTKKGEPVSKAVAGTLSKLDIKPVKIGLTMIAAFEKGEIFKAEVLDIDTEKIFSDFVKAHSNAFNLAFNAGYFTKETTPLLIAKAFNDAKAVALEAGVFNSQTMPILLAKAAREANALKAQIPELEVKEKEKNESPAEEKPAEKKEEA